MQGSKVEKEGKQENKSDKTKMTTLKGNKVTNPETEEWKFYKLLKEAG